jgi:hypothetical protein
MLSLVGGALGIFLGWVISIILVLTATLLTLSGTAVRNAAGKRTKATRRPPG